MTMDLSVMNSETLFNEWFDSIWEVFPGRGSESTARKACHARIFKDKISHEILARAVSNYAEYVRAYRIPTEKSLHGSAFFGPRRYWETFSEGIPDYDGKLFDAPKFQRSSEKSSHGEFNDWFERVWEAYPRKIAKDQMKKACRARVNVDRIPMKFSKAQLVTTLQWFLLAELILST